MSYEYTYISNILFTEKIKENITSNRYLNSIDFLIRSKLLCIQHKRIKTKLYMNHLVSPIRFWIMKNEKYEYSNLQIILIYYYHKPIFIPF